MIKVIISDFSRTILFPKNFTDAHEMNTINRELIAKSLGKDPQTITEQELTQGGEHYRALDVFTLNTPLLEVFNKAREQGVSLRIFTSGFVQTHSDLNEALSIFDHVFNIKENGGFKKTDVQAYLNIIKNLETEFNSIKPNEILFIDDEPGNINAAKESGMQVFLLPKFEKDENQEHFLQESAVRFGDFVKTLIEANPNIET